jgi:hypothetical protein
LRVRSKRKSFMFEMFGGVSRENAQEEAVFIG